MNAPTADEKLRKIEMQMVTAHNISDKSSGQPVSVREQAKIDLFNLTAEFLDNGGDAQRLREILGGKRNTP